MSNGQEPEEYHPTGGLRVTAAAEEAVRRVLLSKRPLVMVFNNVRIKVGLDTSAVAICAEYHAAEEARRAPTEPVCPEGVTAGPCCGGTGLTVKGAPPYILLVVTHDGAIRKGAEPAEAITPALLRYAADLSEYRAVVHAQGQRARALEKVRAAEEAYQKAQVAYDRAGAARDEAGRDMAAARREAGL